MKAILAVDDKMGIGKDGTIPWKFNEDMQYFKSMTIGDKLFCGRKTYESLNGNLPDRKLVVISRSLGSDHEGDIEIRDIISWREMFDKSNWLIGGAVLFNGVAQMELIDQLFLSRIKGDYECDTFIEVPSYLKLASVLTLSENVKVEKWIKNIPEQ